MAEPEDSLRIPDWVNRSLYSPPPVPVKKERFQPIEAGAQGLARFAAGAPNVLKSSAATAGMLLPDIANNPVQSTIRGLSDTALAFDILTDQLNPQQLWDKDFLARSEQEREAARRQADVFARRTGAGIDQAIPDVPVSVKQGLANYAKEQMVQAELNRRQFDIDNPALRGLGNELVSGGVQSIAEMGASFGAGAVTALATRNPAAARAAGLGTMAAFNIDRNISAQQRARGVDTEIDYGSALRTAAAQSAVDSVLGKFIGGDDVARALAGQTFTSSLARGAVAGLGRNALQEGAAEVIQQGLERGQQGFDLFTPNAMNDYGNSFVMGAILGGGVGSVTGALSQAQDLKAQQKLNQEAEARRADNQAALDEERAYQSFFPIQPTETLGLPAPDSKPLLGLPAPEAGPAPQIEAPRMVVDAEGNVRPEATVGGLPDTFSVTPEGEAVPREDTYTPRMVEKAFGVTSPEREAEREVLVERAGTEKIITPDSRSPFTATPMIAVKGKPTYRVRILGPSEREGYVRVLNEDTKVVVDVPRKRLVSKPEAKDPDVVAKLPPSVRRAEELRAKELHQKQLDAMLYRSPPPATVPPASAPEGSPPLPSVDATPMQEGQPPMVQGEFDFDPAAEVPQDAPPVAEIPQDTGTDPALFTEQGGLPFAPDTEFGAPPLDQRPQGELPFAPDTEFGQPPMEPDTTGELPFEQGLPEPLPPAEEVLPPDVEDLPPLTRNEPKAPERKPATPKQAAPEPAPRPPSQGLTTREQQYNDAGPIAALEMLAKDAPQYAPIARKVAETMQRMIDSGHVFNFLMVTDYTQAESRSEQSALRKSGVGGLSSWHPARRKTNIYVPAMSMGRHGAGLSQTEAMMHEFLHAVTQPAIYYSDKGSSLGQIKGVKADAFAKELETIRKELNAFVAKEKKRLQGLSLERRAAARSKMPQGLLDLIDRRSAALQDANELLAYGMTQPKMLQFYDTVSGKGKSVFTKFVEAVRNFLSLPASQDSALSRIIAATEGLMDRDMAVDTANTQALLASKFGGNMGSIENFNQSQTSTPEFRNWFGNSKVVDDNGQPLVVYHSTENNFDAFDIGAKPVNRTGNIEGAYFTPELREAQTYGGSRIVAAYLSIKRPYIAGQLESTPEMEAAYRDALIKSNIYIDPVKDRDWFDRKIAALREKKRIDYQALNGDGRLQRLVLQAGGYDGFKDGRHWVAFEPTQIKSAINNRGTFDPSEPNINFAIQEQQAAPVGQATAGVAQTATTGPELANPAPPMSTTDSDAVYVLQQVNAATRDPAFLQALERALREELRALGFNGRIPVQLQFNPNASHWAMARSNNGQTIAIALGLANDAKDVPGAVQALRPFLTGSVVAFGEQHGLLRPDERAELLAYARNTKDVNGKTLFENVAERFPGVSTQKLEREAIAYATEQLTRLNPAKWQQEKAATKRGRADPRARVSRKKTPQEKTAFDFKAKIKAIGKALFQSVKPDVAYDIAMRLAKGDVAYRARGDQRFIQPVQFAGWVTPPAQAKALGEQLRKYMDDMGLSDIGLRMSTAILKPEGKGWTAAGKDVHGAYFARTVTLSMAAYDPNLSIEANLEKMKQLVDHEVVHALRATGAWTPSQWLNLVKYVTSARDPATNETYLEKAQRIYGAYTKDMSPSVARDVLNEEAVAMAFAHNFDVDNPVPSGPRNLLNRIAQVLFGVGKASYDTGILSPEMLTPNGNQLFAAIRSGQAAKNRREAGASSPADTAVKFSIASTVTQDVNPGIDPEPGDVITQSNKRNRNPFDEYLRSSDLFNWLLQQEERDVPLTQRIPGLSKIFAPLARLVGHDAFLRLKGRTTGAISNMKQEIATAIDEAQKIVGNDARKREQITAYMEGGWQADPKIIEDARLRELSVALKLRVSQHGRLAVEQGLLSKEAFDRLDGKYLHRMYTTDKNRIFNSVRLLMPDMGWTKSRSQIGEIEKIARGEVTDPLVSIANYLAKSGEALLIDRMMDTMAMFAAKQDTDRPWVMDAQDMIQWRGKDWSPLAVEAEIESLRTDVRQAAAEWANPDPVRVKKTEVVEDTLKNARLLLMRNPLWLKLRGLTPADVATSLGVAPDADTTTVPKEVVEAAYDNFLRITPDVRNNQGAVGAQFKELGDSVVANFLGDDYIQVPNTYKWGRLRGMMVVREVYDIMNATGAILQNSVEDRASVQAEQDVGFGQKAMSFIGSPEAAQWVMSFYKKAKTVFNPSTHGVNWVGNMVTFETLGGAVPGESVRYGYNAIRQIMSAEGPAYEVFRDFGGGQTGQHASELTALADPRFQAALKESLGGLESGDVEMSGKELFNAVRAAWAKIDGKVSDFYQLSDSVFKVAKIQMDMDRGLPPEEAFLNAQDLFLDYTVVPPFIRALRSLPMGSPFITWTYLMSGQIIDKIGSMTTFKVREDGSRLEIPTVITMLPAFGAYILANAIMGADDFEDEDKKYLTVGLPSFTDGGKGLVFAGLDSQGRPQYFDVGKYWAGMTLVRLLGKFDDVQESDSRPSGFGGVLSELGFMSDPYSQAMLIMMGREPQSFRPVSKTGSLPAEGMSAQVGALIDLMLPPWMGGFGNGTNSLFGDYGLANSLASRDVALPYEQGRPALTFGQKSAKFFGVTTYLTDPMPAMEKKVKEATRLRGLVQGELSRIKDDPALDPEAKAAKAEKVRDRYERMVAREEDMKTLQAEMAAFYGRYSQAVIAKGLPDPYLEDRDQIDESNQRNKKIDIDRYMESIAN